MGEQESESKQGISLGARNQNHMFDIVDDDNNFFKGPISNYKLYQTTKKQFFCIKKTFLNTKNIKIDGSGVV